LARINERFAALGNVPLFTTDAENLWETYLESFPESERQFHNCSACRHFIRRFGGLVTIDEKGKTRPAIWYLDVASGAYIHGVNKLHDVVARAKVTGVFRSSSPHLGVSRTGDWTHFHATVPVTSPALKWSNQTLLTAGQAMAVDRENHANVMRALAEFSPDLLAKAVELLESDALYRSDAVIGPARFLLGLHRNAAASRTNSVWSAVSTAPDGFCHPRSSMVGTLLEDLASGMSAETVARRFADKMAPSRYQRAQAAPTVGAIRQAEDTIAKLGLARSLERRFARMDEVIGRSIWVSTAGLSAASEAMPSGVFGNLVPKNETAPAAVLEIPKVTMTWAKFSKSVLPNACAIEALIPSDANRLAALVTAAHDDAPPILAWDNDGSRNRFSWFYAAGVDAELRQRVLDAGGQYDDVDIRASLLWNNRNDLDIHCVTPRSEHIFYGNKRSRTCHGWLDVDMNVTGETTKPVENIRWSRGKASVGRYTFYVENFNFHEHTCTATPFRVELEINGKILAMDGVTRAGAIRDASRVLIAQFDYIPGRACDSVATECRPANGSEMQGVRAGTFAKVDAIVKSPNVWENAPNGSGSHTMFLLDGCKAEDIGQARGFFAEMLRPELRPIRSVIEAHTASATIGESGGADACGLGMNDSTPWNLTLRVKLKSGSVGHYLIDRFE
jgi:hypothetical protein